MNTHGFCSLAAARWNAWAWECPVPSRQLQVLLRPDTVRYGVHSAILRDGGPDIDVDRQEMMQEQLWLLMTRLNCLVIVAGKDLDRMVGANRTDIGIPMGNSEIDAPKKLWCLMAVSSFHFIVDNSGQIHITVQTEVVTLCSACSRVGIRHPHISG